MNDIDSLVIAALAIEKEDDDNLKSLLKKAGFLFLPMLMKYIKKTETALDEVLQDDFEELGFIFTDLFKKVKKKPSKRKLSKILKNRDFTSSFKSTVNPILAKTFDEIAKASAKKYKSEFSFELMSDLAKKDLAKWLEELPNLMKLTTDDAVTQLIIETYENGKGVNWALTRLSEMHEFSRNRARTTSITEVLTMYSDATYQALMQNNGVIGFEWVHTVGIKEPRKAHENMSGTIISKDEFFIVNGEMARFPRDTVLSAKERINCHCRLKPVFYKDLKGGGR